MRLDGFAILTLVSFVLIVAHLVGVLPGAQ